MAAIEGRVRELTEMIGELLDEIEEVTDELVNAVDHAEEEVEAAQFESSRSSGWMDWLDRVVFEVEGRMMDGESPGVILASLVTELSERTSFDSPNEFPLAV